MKKTEFRQICRNKQVCVRTDCDEYVRVTLDAAMKYYVDCQNKNKILKIDIWEYFVYIDAVNLEGQKL